MDFTLWVNEKINYFNEELLHVGISNNLYKYYSDKFSKYCNKCIEKYDDNRYELVDELKGDICRQFNILIKCAK